MNLLARLRDACSILLFGPPSPSHDGLCAYADALLAHYAAQWDALGPDWQASPESVVYATRIKNYRAWMEALNSLQAPDPLYRALKLSGADVDTQEVKVGP